MSIGLCPPRGPEPHAVLLHGWSGSAQRTWWETGWADALTARGWSIDAPDLIGHGLAPRPHDPAAYADLASDVASRIKPRPSRSVLIGYSLGAKIALELACREPEAFDCLVLLGVGANAFRPEEPGAVVDGLEGAPDPQAPSLVGELVAAGCADGNDPLALAACLRRPANPVLTARRLASLELPALLVAGADDVFIGDAQTLAGALPEGELHVVAGVGHLDTPESPEVRAVVERRLATLRHRSV